MKYISEEDLRAHLINDGCDDGCGYLDERDIPSLPWIELDATDDDVLDKISAELHATAEMHEDENYYLRDEWIDEIIDKYRKEHE